MRMLTLLHYSKQIHREGHLKSGIETMWGLQYDPPLGPKSGVQEAQDSEKETYFSPKRIPKTAF